jgi:hypothetical protein
MYLAEFLHPSVRLPWPRLSVQTAVGNPHKYLEGGREPAMAETQIAIIRAVRRHGIQCVVGVFSAVGDFLEWRLRAKHGSE